MTDIKFKIKDSGGGGDCFYFSVFDALVNFKLMESLIFIILSINKSILLTILNIFLSVSFTNK